MLDDLLKTLTVSVALNSSEYVHVDNIEDYVKNNIIRSLVDEITKNIVIHKTLDENYCGMIYSAKLNIVPEDKLPKLKEIIKEYNDKH